MTSFSDTLTVGLVLVLLFGSIALYLYTRIQQAEQKIGLLESILLNLKMSSEITSYSDIPADEMPFESNEHQAHLETYEPFSENHTAARPPSPQSQPRVESPVHDTDVEEYKSAIAEAVKEEEIAIVKADELDSNKSQHASYDAMTLKELQALAKTRGITGAGSMKKGPIIEALKTSDRVQATSVEPGSNGITAIGGSFLETSGSFLTQESS